MTGFIELKKPVQCKRRFALKGVSSKLRIDDRLNWRSGK